MRNRIRQNVIPLLKAENPRFSEDVSNMAISLREDEQALDAEAHRRQTVSTEVLRDMEPAIRHRVISAFLQESGVPEPERKHVALAEELLFSPVPSARGDFPGGVCIGREYDKLTALKKEDRFAPVEITVPGTAEVPELGIRVVCENTEERFFHREKFTVQPVGKVILRTRLAGDSLRLTGGTKSLKKLFIDKKIPASVRDRVAVLADDLGILGVQGLGADVGRVTDRGVCVTIEKL